MKVLWNFRLLYWTGCLLLLTGIFVSFTEGWHVAGLLATLFLPSAIWGSWMYWVILNGKKPWWYWIYAVVGILWLSYAGGITGYSYLFELDPTRFPKVVINPIFALFWTTAMAAGQHLLEARWFAFNAEVRMIAFTSERQHFRIPEETVLYIESRNTFTLIHTDHGVHSTKQSISSWAEELPQFLRTHRSILVNPSHIIGHKSTLLTLRKGKEHIEVPVSRTYKKEVQELLQND